MLRLRADHPELHSPELAERLSEKLGRPINPGALRMALQRSRDRFVGFLLEDVAACLAEPTPDLLEQELIDLDLLEYCKAFRRRKGQISSRPQN